MLCAAALLCGRKVQRLRFFAAAALAAALSCVILFPPLKPIPLLLLKLLSAAAIVVAAFGMGGVRSFFHVYLCFLAVTAVFGGCVYAVAAALSQPITVNNLTYYFGGAPLALLGLIVVIYFAVRLALSAFRARLPQSGSAKLLLVNGEREISLTAFVDTGNRLSDVISGRPVLIISGTAAEKLLTPLQKQVKQAADLGQPPPGGVKFSLVPCETVAGSGLLVGFPDISAYLIKDKKRLPTELLAAVGPQKAGYDALIGEEALKNAGGES